MRFLVKTMQLARFWRGNGSFRAKSFQSDKEAVPGFLISFGVYAQIVLKLHRTQFGEAGAKI